MKNVLKVVEIVCFITGSMSLLLMTACRRDGSISIRWIMIQLFIFIISCIVAHICQNYYYVTGCILSTVLLVYYKMFRHHMNKDMAQFVKDRLKYEISYLDFIINMASEYEHICTLKQFEEEED